MKYLLLVLFAIGCASNVEKPLKEEPPVAVIEVTHEDRVWTHPIQLASSYDEFEECYAQCHNNGNDAVWCDMICRGITD